MARSSAPQLQLLRAAGVEVVLARLDKLRDPNFLYSSLWRLGLRWWDGPRGPLGFETRRLNFKSDHRKVVIADDGDALVAVVGSANPEDRQSGWSNLAARVSGDAVGSLLASELAIARFSGWSGDSEPFLRAADPQAPDAVLARGSWQRPCPRRSPRTARASRCSRKGRRAACSWTALPGRGTGDAIDIARLRHRRPRRDRGTAGCRAPRGRRTADTRPKRGCHHACPFGPAQPAQPRANWSSRSGGAIRVRWYRTHGERFHGDDGARVDLGSQLWLTLGSANLTRRSLDDYNLEANLGLEVLRDAPLAQQVQGYFDTLWSNRAALGIEYTADFAVFADSKQADYWLSRLLEGAGFTAVLTPGGRWRAHRLRGLLRKRGKGGVGRPARRRPTTSVMRLAAAVAVPAASKVATTSRASRRPMMQSSATCTSGAAAPAL